MKGILCVCMLGGCACMHTHVFLCNAFTTGQANNMELHMLSQMVKIQGLLRISEADDICYRSCHLLKTRKIKKKK